MPRPFRWSRVHPSLRVFAFVFVITLLLMMLGALI
jgi:hypothetical protein